MRGRVLVTGATGFIGGRLAMRLASAGWDVRCLVRDRYSRRAQALARAGLHLHQGDALSPHTLRNAGRGVDVCVLLDPCHGQRRAPGLRADRAGRGGQFRKLRPRGGDRARHLSRRSRRSPHSRHLRSRHETALALARHGPPITYFRAGMVVGAESESYRTLRYLVQRLPAMIAPGWLKNPTQPISIDDTLSYLSDELTNERSVGREIQIGGPDVLSYADMLDRTAEILGLEPRPRMSIAAFQHGQAAVTKRQVQITSARGHSREDLELAGRRA